MQNTDTVRFLAALLPAALVLAGCGNPDAVTRPAQEPPAASAPAPVKAQERIAPDDDARGRLNEKWAGDLDGMLERRYIRVLVIPDKMHYFFDGAELKGVTYDAMREFESFVNKKVGQRGKPIAVLFVPTRRDEIFQALVDGRGDLAAGSLGISDERRAIVDFSDPIRDRIKVIPVGGPDAPPIKSLDDLAGQTVYVPASSALPGIVAGLNQKFREAGRPPVVVKPADENLEIADIYEMVGAGLVPFTLGDSLTAEFWAKVFDRIHPYSDLPLLDTGAMGWAFRKGSPKLKAIVNEFIAGHREGTAYGNTMLRKYLGSTKWVKNATAEQEMAKFRQMVALFRKYGDQANLPYLLVVAQAYQESGLDQSARSPMGAVGVLQIKPSTAAGKPIEVADVHKLENNIKAGTKYLRFLVDRYYADEPMDRVTRGLFAIASYNAGPARVQQLRRKAAAEGLDPNRWFNHVEQVAAREIGRETVQYVANIYKYYLAYKMVTESTAARDAVKSAKESSPR